jgi:hypothetical protein
MANKRTQGNPSRGRRDVVATSSPYEEARDELFQHVMQCGVIGADAAHQGEWFDNTIAYLADRYPELSPAQIAELRTLGERFAQPPKRQTATSAA